MEKLLDSSQPQDLLVQYATELNVDPEKIDLIDLKELANSVYENDYNLSLSKKYKKLLNLLEDIKEKINPVVYAVLSIRLELKINEGRGMFVDEYKNKEFIEIANMIANIHSGGLAILLMNITALSHGRSNKHKSVKSLLLLKKIIDSENSTVDAQEDSKKSFHLSNLSKQIAFSIERVMNPED